MNGSAIFLFAALKMKLRMAARRLLARRRGAPAPSAGALTAEERDAAGPLLETLIEGLGLPETLRADAHAVSARRDSPEAARHLLGWFEAGGAGPS